MKIVNHGKKKAEATSTATHETTYNNKPLLQIFEVNAENENISDYALISFGLVKAKAILNHVEEIKAFVEKQS